MDIKTLDALRRFLIADESVFLGHIEPETNEDPEVAAWLKESKRRIQMEIAEMPNEELENIFVRGIMPIRS